MISSDFDKLYFALEHHLSGGFTQQNRIKNMRGVLGQFEDLGLFSTDSTCSSQQTIIGVDSNLFLIWKEDKEKRVQFLENVRFTMGLLDMVHVGITYLLFCMIVDVK